MERYQFADLLADLELGREIEFVYDGRQYGITSGGGFWRFHVDSQGETLCRFTEIDRLLRWAEVLRIGDVPLSEVIDRQLYERGTLYIL